MCVAVCVWWKQKATMGRKEMSWIEKGVGGTKGKAAEGWAWSFYETQSYLQPACDDEEKEQRKESRNLVLIADSK